MPEIRDCANHDGHIQRCRCGGTACPGWCHVVSTDPDTGTGHHCRPFGTGLQPHPVVAHA